MASKKKSPKKAVSAKKRKVGAVVMKRRGAKARLRNALKATKQGVPAGRMDQAREADGDRGGNAKGLKKHISRIKTKTRAIASKLTKTGGDRSGSN